MKRTNRVPRKKSAQSFVSELALSRYECKHRCPASQQDVRTLNLVLKPMLITVHRDARQFVQLYHFDQSLPNSASLIQPRI
ncbi:BQ5605_C010g06203 [Microbotryum silenes-dioicae]|uniref:BQ5605_C010g06203 protein n=1 Tax=Microbotryum silenes-dioicae TaxID=796604 RepID=A0A2X0LQW8_9BASI|nr:BQ5605_C010g06203 [Microbotryum silenes-dioicae]